MPARSSGGRRNWRGRGQRRGPGASAVPAVSGGVAGIAGAGGDRDDRCDAETGADLRASAGIRGRRARCAGSAGRGSRWAPCGGGVEGVGRSAPAVAGPGLLDAGEVASGSGRVGTHGYFPGIEIRTDTPRVLLVCPSLEFHPTTETILSYFAPGIEVERIGLAVEWRRGLQMVFRLQGAERPE